MLIKHQNVNVKNYEQSS